MCRIMKATFSLPRLPDKIILAVVLVAWLEIIDRFIHLMDHFESAATVTAEDMRLVE
jgi:hypothetical protein